MGYSDDEYWSREEERQRERREAERRREKWKKEVAKNERLKEIQAEIEKVVAIFDEKLDKLQAEVDELKNRTEPPAKKSKTH